MGARVQVKVISEMQGEHPVYLYAHWGAGGPTRHAVSMALLHGGKEGRRTDFEYLNRIIFCKMVEDPEGSLSYGIGTEIHGDIEEFIVLDLKEQAVYHYEGFDSNVMNDMDNGRYERDEIKPYTFSEFAKKAIGE